MPTPVALFVPIAAGYVLGSLPFPYWLAKWRGVDLTATGTRNPGAANLFREVSAPLGVLALALDIGKGAGAVLIARALDLSSGEALGPGAAAVVGHWHSLFLDFRGGVALATATGVALGALPASAPIGLGVTLVAIAVTRNVGRSAGLGCVALLAAGLGFGEPHPTLFGVLGIALAVLMRALAVERRHA